MPGPAAATKPEKSRPSTKGNTACEYWPLRTFQSAPLTLAATTSTTTSPAAATGSGKSPYFKTSGPPNCSMKAAFIICRLFTRNAHRFETIRSMLRLGDHELWVRYPLFNEGADLERHLARAQACRSALPPSRRQPRSSALPKRLLLGIPEWRMNTSCKNSSTAKLAVGSEFRPTVASTPQNG